MDVEAPKAISLAESIRNDSLASQVCQQALSALLYYGQMPAFATSEAADWANKANRYAKRNSREQVRADILSGAVKSMMNHRDIGIPLLQKALNMAKQIGDQQLYQTS